MQRLQKRRRLAAPTAVSRFKGTAHRGNVLADAILAAVAKGQPAGGTRGVALGGGDAAAL